MATYKYFFILVLSFTLIPIYDAISEERHNQSDSMRAGSPIKTREDVGPYTTLDGCSTNGAALSSQDYDALSSSAEISCCSEDGQSCYRHNPDSGECWSGDNDAAKANWHEAYGMCVSAGYRLCNSQDELDLCCGTGCMYDFELVWTSIEAAPEEGYEYYKLRSCSGRNELFAGVVDDRSECRSKCDNDNYCVSFEWWGESNPHPSKGSMYCQVSSSCTYDVSVESSSSDPADLYVKEVDDSSSCDGTLVEVIVQVQFFEQALAGTSTYEKMVISSESFNSALDELSTEASIEGEYGDFSAAASGSYTRVTDEVTSMSNSLESISEETVEFMDGWLQLFKVLTTQVSIDGTFSATATLTEQTYEDAISEENSLSYTELKDMETEYIQSNFDAEKGTMDNNKYIESVCVPLVLPSAFFELFQENGGKPSLVCTFDLSSVGYTELNRDHFEIAGCKNDEARSMTLCYARKGTTITLYDSPKFKTNDDYVEITVLYDMDGCQTIDTFEENEETVFLNVVYHEDNGLDGKVSAVVFNVIEA